MFKNYHIVIFKDREGGFRNLRLRGWFSLLLLLLFAALAGGNIYLWEYYSKARVLEQEMKEAQKRIRDHDTQALSLAGKLQALENDVKRVQRFDAKLRVFLNVDTDPADEEADEQRNLSDTGSASLSNPRLLARHRELFIQHMHGLVDELAENIRIEEVEQQTLAALMRLNQETLLATPAIWPVKGYLTSGFGPRRAPTAGSSRLHKGLDISNRVGTPISATARGAVTFSGADGAYGISVRIDHGNGIVTRYAHMDRTLVKVGAYVQRGDVIGALGNSGRSTGPHLHYEVIINGTPVNPMRYILN